MVAIAVVELCRILSNAQAVILACVKRRVGAVSPDDLPDAQLTLGFDLIPAKLRGHGQ